MSDLRTKLDTAIFNGHGGGSVSSRWTVDSILNAILPIITSELALNQAAIVREAESFLPHGECACGPKRGNNPHFPDCLESVRQKILAIPTDQPALDKYNYSQWERGYGDGITGMGAVLAGAPLENLPEANREQARRWIDRHDAELKAQFAAVMEKAAEACGASDGWDMHPKDYARLVRALASPVSEQAGAPEETSK